MIIATIRVKARDLEYSQPDSATSAGSMERPHAATFLEQPRGAYVCVCVDAT